MGRDDIVIVTLDGHTSTVGHRLVVDCQLPFEPVDWNHALRHVCTCYWGALRQSNRVESLLQYGRE